MYSYSTKTPDFKYLFEKKVYSDIVIKLDNDIKIKAHKCILCKIHFYEKMFSNEYSEKDIDEIKHENVSETSVNQMLNYLYNGKFVFDKISDLIECYEFTNMIGYTELQDLLIDQIDLQKLASKENINMLVKKLISVKDINEELILNKIERILKLKSVLQRENELQEYCDEKLRIKDVTDEGVTLNDNYYIHNGNNYSINLCKKVITVKEANILSSIMINNKIDPTFVRLVNNITLYYIPDKLVKSNRNINEITNYEHRLVTEKTLYIEYEFMRKYDKKIFKLLEKVYKEVGCNIYILDDSIEDYKIICTDILKNLNEKVITKYYKF
jgi:hypothetical protein